MKDQLPALRASEAHATKANAHAAIAVLPVHDLVGRQRHTESIWKVHEGTGWTILKDRQVLHEVPFTVQACASDKRDQDHLLRPVGARHVHRPIVPSSRDVQTPRVAAHFAVLNQAAGDVGFDVHVAVLATVGTGDNKLVGTHAGIILRDDATQD
jgi:hypothetical protein